MWLSSITVVVGDVYSMLDKGIADLIKLGVKDSKNLFLLYYKVEEMLEKAT